MIQIGLIGFGGISKSHLGPHYELQKKGISRLVAVCDICEDRFEQKLEINTGCQDVSLGETITRYMDWREMLQNEELDMVDICVPTYMHAEIAIGALEAGVHVLCEKPMSLNYEQCKKMCEKADSTGRKLMIAQCCRFSPAFLYLKELVENSTYGKVKSAVFKRLSGPPVWGWNNWYMDYTRSGGAILDMHIHDIDIIRYICGEPKGVTCITQDIYSGKDVVHSRLVYDDFSVLAIGDWSRDGVPFEAGFSVSFERATVVRDSKGVVVYPRGGEKFVPELKNANVYQAELEYFIETITEAKENMSNSPEDSALSVKLVEVLVESSEKNGEYVSFGKTLT